METLPRKSKRAFVLWVLVLFGWMVSATLINASPDESSSGDRPAGAASVWLLSLDGAIGPATGDLITRSLRQAAGADASLFVLQLNTPGGLDKAMRDIIQTILASPVPVATYVYPKGARAASAGTYILYASHIAAMAPATNIGSATPVQIGGGGQQDRSPRRDRAPEAEGQAAEQDQPTQQGQQREQELSAIERKQINDAVAYIRGLAELRGRNADWAEQAVRQAENIGAQEALRLNVIDVVADNVPSLLSQLNGRVVQLDQGQVRLDLDAYNITQVEPDWRSQFLAVITDPSVAYILMLVGIYGLILEFYNPGMGLPGVLGGICLLVALYALQMLPISYVGLGLILLGIALMIAEAFAPSFGVLGIGGAAAFVMGSVMLMDTDIPAYQIAMPVILGITIFSVLVFTVLVHMAVKARRRAVVTGMEALVGVTGDALQDFDTEGYGYVRVQGERWRARSKEGIKKGDRVQVTTVQGLVLHVELKA
jgi:membrane-bound serine protease (ClpP class)